MLLARAQLALQFELLHSLEEEGHFTTLEDIKCPSVLKRLKDPRSFTFSRLEAAYDYNPAIVNELKVLEIAYCENKKRSAKISRKAARYSSEPDEEPQGPE